MKNIVIFVLVIATLVAGYFALAGRLRMNLAGLTGELEEVVRGDLTLPINATGAIRPALRVEIKSEASGAVKEIGALPGELVRKGQRIVLLEPDDEQRSVDRAQRELDVAVARLEESKVALKQAQTAEIASAEARIRQLEESVRLAKYRWDKLQQTEDRFKSEEELIQRETTYLSQEAQLAEARAALDRAQLNSLRLEQTVRQNQAAVDSAHTSLGDAQKRLKDTDVSSPIDGVVADVYVQIGEVIQGGKTTFTGGTVLAVVLDTERLIVRAEVDESDIGRVLAIAPDWARPGHEGSVVMPGNLAEAAEKMPLEHRPTIAVESFPDQEFQGAIERVYPEPRTLSNVITYLVDVVITSPNRQMLLSGMRADVRFTSEHSANVLLCPNEAIREGPDGKLGVYVPDPSSPKEERRTRFVPVRLGLDNGAFSEIRDGLSEGDKVYTKLPAKQESQGRKGRVH